MKKGWLKAVLLLSLVVLQSCSDDNSINPSRSVYDAGTLVLHGTHTNRGFAHGYVKGTGVKRIFDELIIGSFFVYHSDSSRADSLYEARKSFIANKFTIEQIYRDEAAGILKGMKAAGVPIRNQILGRDLDSMDILMITCVEEFLLAFDHKFGCSSISAWGSATSGDSLLKGETVITRAWDWNRHPAIMDNLLYVVHHPSEPSEQKWCGVIMAGMVGCHSIMTENMGAFLNYGYQDTIDNIGPYRIISLAMREAIEKRDINGDGKQNNSDVVSALSKSVPYFSAIVHSVSARSTGDSSVVIELSNRKGVKTRFSKSDPAVEGPSLIATNHMRVEYTPENCWRYEGLKNGLNSAYPDTSLSMEKMWDLHTKAAGVAWNQYFLLFVPSSGILKLSRGTVPVPGYQVSPTTFLFKDY
ncbi:MAG: hypothetical protein JNL74_21680 [Fibrobacteres bacterium]|nr:hypothetical protein [Fibrobacterota bacterium]